ncbi:hypothetical protein [Sediminibacterium ginsengisoli]|uniref:Uncharacterized protein n=1 Tax=Sediminibacterium ginsengisoli TaxID=413434 RepID=A0A1T4NY92_9BACT|nr:hypothetical protein [Sediminibacterium ginsengisoli]SJZ84223.1 hypothetical protein SAMN04488132_10553 [Sediminibacterium ginsengisoli]
MDRHIPNTLISYPDVYIERCEKLYGFKISEKFVDCANTQLTRAFENTVGFKVNKLVGIGWISSPYQEFFLRKGPTTEFSSEISVNHYNFPVTILWKSKSGRIYNMEDVDVDCSDIQFWFEGIDPLAYNKEMFPNIGQPFKLKDLSYELSVDRLNTDCTIQLQIRESLIVDTVSLLNQVDEFIGNYNERSEKNNRIDGVVHNWKHFVEGNLITYEIDLGSARASFLKKLLQFFSKLNSFARVKVE